MTVHLVKEFVPPETYEAEGEQAIRHVDSRILDTIDQLNSYFGVKPIINTWHLGGTFKYRCYRPENCTQGAKKSAHKMDPCIAVDFDIPDKRPGAIKKADSVRQIIINNRNRFPHIRRMESGVNWVHVDLKEVPGWDYNKKGIYLFAV